MIVRIMHAGQFELDADHGRDLQRLDDDLLAAIEALDEEHYRRGTAEAFALVHTHGRVLEPGRLVPSDLVLPPQDATVAEVHALLAASHPQDFGPR